MVAVMTLHMIQVFLWGAHKYPRELTWIVGVFLFLCTLGMAFTGQLMRWDQDAYWGSGLAAPMPRARPSAAQSGCLWTLEGPSTAAARRSLSSTATWFWLPAFRF